MHPKKYGLETPLGHDNGFDETSVPIMKRIVHLTSKEMARPGGKDLTVLLRPFPLYII